ncbi:hypothetical protein [Elizabethkingia sp. M8]|uniref:hypothetical protein n=1 Tax=Elizabethkingia sp. M8 TaxID=2796140 RepID=UPI0019052D4C|nr:hypothetical protein [Elizabethkingia sp. M8]QQM26594.1 hypothetical protein JCR23_17410 [Elizabethkingia sp. M8]
MEDKKMKIQFDRDYMLSEFANILTEEVQKYTLFTELKYGNAEVYYSENRLPFIAVYIGDIDDNINTFIKIYKMNGKYFKDIKFSMKEKKLSSSVEVKDIDISAISDIADKYLNGLYEVMVTDDDD